MVYTHSNRHDGQLRALTETWAKHCDGFLAASNLTDKSLGAVDLWHEGPEIYNNMWLKIRSMVRCFKYLMLLSMKMTGCFLPANCALFL